VQEHTKAIESVNVDGGRFIREAKVTTLFNKEKKIENFCRVNRLTDPITKTMRIINPHIDI